MKHLILITTCLAMCLTIMTEGVCISEGAGFVALPASRMNWGDAKGFCEQRGGRLPLVNGSISLPHDAVWNANPRHLVAGTYVEGFTSARMRWEEVGLPTDCYWTGTVLPDRPGYSWLVTDVGGRQDPGGISFLVTSDKQRLDCRAVCVP